MTVLDLNVAKQAAQHQATIQRLHAEKAEFEASTSKDAANLKAEIDRLNTKLTFKVT